MIHRDALVAKQISPGLNAVVQDAVQVISFVKSRALNNSLFENLCREMESEFKILLMHGEVRWLSKAKALTLSLPRSSIDDLVFSMFPSNFVKLSYKISLLKNQFVTLFFIRFS